MGKKMTKHTHGGKRKGAGRKPSAPTVVMRVPKALVEQVRAFIKKHIDDSTEKM